MERLVPHPPQPTITISGNYRGNPHNPENIPQQVGNNPNTSLWITNLPSQTSHSDIFSSIRRIDAIKAHHVNAPNDTHPEACAAKLVFFEDAPAERLLNIARAGQFIVRSQAATAEWNRVATREDPPQGRSRVLRIEGPLHVVNQVILEAFWAQSF
ncbi:Uu.00g067800.m01.CDS01 [Anthostomella pinea]|uniref:Uu.00g067800.m01.CDS01 n=1 Tax=Anthostomella pinea TaxID=933095 RepID=A0AAI8VUU7_9PEZI|nr:Uu.00g067800.m01.CDS01 [Anthostomella pinea]